MILQNYPLRRADRLKFGFKSGRHWPGREEVQLVVVTASGVPDPYVKMLENCQPPARARTRKWSPPIPPLPNGSPNTPYKLSPCATATVVHPRPSRPWCEEIPVDHAAAAISNPLRNVM